MGSGDLVEVLPWLPGVVLDGVVALPLDEEQALARDGIVLVVEDVVPDNKLFNQQIYESLM